MSKEMYRINSDLHRFGRIYMYGDPHVRQSIQQDLEEKGIRISGFFSDNGIGIPEDTAVILYGIDAKLPRLLKQTGVSNLFLHRFLYQEEIMALAQSEGVTWHSLFTGVPELYEKENVIFGVGEDGHRLFMETLNIGIHITAFCDSNPAYQGMYLMNKPVLSMDELCGAYQDCNLLIGSRKYFDEISRQLSDCGFDRLYSW